MFDPGDRVFSHYTMSWGTVLEAQSHDDHSGTWYQVKFDRGSMDLMNDADGNWEMARIVPPDVAVRYGYPADTKSVVAPSLDGLIKTLRSETDLEVEDRLVVRLSGGYLCDIKLDRQFVVSARDPFDGSILYDGDTERITANTIEETLQAVRGFEEVAYTASHSNGDALS